MFTGIIEEVGKIKSINRISSGFTIDITADRVLQNSKVGDSIAVNGVCLTATGIDDKKFSVDVSFETLRVSNIGNLKINDSVNLERALLLSDRLSGHIVLGHIDSKTKVNNISKQGDFYLLQIANNSYINRYSVEKGSITIDGISLTIAKKTSSFLEIAIIPHTFSNTTLQYIKPGNYVNIEVDILGKYIEQFTNQKSITKDFLMENGFV